MCGTLNMFIVKKEINKNVTDKAKRFEALCRIIRTTREYQNCKKLYDLFVIEVANYLHEIGIKDSSQAIIYLDLLLRNGELSITGKNDYHLYKNDYEYACELFGARTIGGISVCRHMSALTTDILNIEHYAAWLNGKYIRSIDEIDNQEPFNHAVVGIIVDDGKIIYDPTASSFASLPKEKIYTIKSQARVAETFISYTSLASIGDLIILNSQQYLVNPESQSELAEVWYTPFKAVNIEEFKKLAKETNELYQDTYPKVKEFKSNIADIAKEIVKLESQLHPHSDDKILKWELKQ